MKAEPKRKSVRIGGKRFERRRVIKNENLSRNRVEDRFVEERHEEFVTRLICDFGVWPRSETPRATGVRLEFADGTSAAVLPDGSISVAGTVFDDPTKAALHAARVVSEPEWS